MVRLIGVGSKEEEGGKVTLSQMWENYDRARNDVKKTLMKEKKELRKRTVRKIIREQDGTCCNELFWTDLGGKEEGDKDEINGRLEGRIGEQNYRDWRVAGGVCARRARWNCCWGKAWRVLVAQ